MIGNRLRFAAIAVALIAFGCSSSASKTSETSDRTLVDDSGGSTPSVVAGCVTDNGITVTQATVAIGLSGAPIVATKYVDETFELDTTGGEWEVTFSDMSILEPGVGEPASLHPISGEVTGTVAVGGGTTYIEGKVGGGVEVVTQAPCGIPQTS